MSSVTKTAVSGVADLLIIGCVVIAAVWILGQVATALKDPLAKLFGTAPAAPGAQTPVNNPDPSANSAVPNVNTAATAPTLLSTAAAVVTGSGPANGPYLTPDTTSFWSFITGGQGFNAFNPWADAPGPPAVSSGANADQVIPPDSDYPGSSVPDYGAITSQAMAMTNLYGA
jgi:hypothetical protein